MFRVIQAEAFADSAWPSLDDNDNEPTRFWVYTFAALKNSMARIRHRWKLVSTLALLVVGIVVGVILCRKKD